MPRRRLWQLAAIFALTLVAAFAEVATLGTLVPFLGLLADPHIATSLPGLQDVFFALGWTRPDDLLVPVTVAFCMFAAGAGGMRVLVLWANQRFNRAIGNDLAVAAYQRVLHQPYGYHVANNTSAQIAALNKINLVVGAYVMQLLQVVSSAVLATAIFAGLLAINAAVALTAMLGFGALYAVVAGFSRMRLSQNSRIWSRTETARINVLREGLGGIRDVLIDGTQAAFVGRFSGLDQASRRAVAQNMLLGVAPRYLIEAIGMVMIAGLAVVMTLRSGGLTQALPLLGALALGAQRLLPLIHQIYGGWSVVVGSRAALDDVLTILDLPEGQEGRADAAPLPFARGIAFDRVSFRYGPDAPLAIDDVSFAIPRGARVGIVGLTGSGKSTLVDLLLGLLAPTAGTITVDGTGLGPATLRAWQGRIAHVPQAIYLADASVAANVAFGVPEPLIDMARVREAAAQARLAEFVDRLSQGYDTLVGEGGVRLSGGQRQRIAIARALYKRADVLVFDEATSALDNATEATVMSAIEGLSRELTIVMIAHRLSTLSGCDEVIELEAGRIVRRCDFATLVEDIPPVGLRTPSHSLEAVN